jgi:hypothetical protein
MFPERFEVRLQEYLVERSRFCEQPAEAAIRRVSLSHDLAVRQ